jgi:hypothetical protein
MRAFVQLGETQDTADNLIIILGGCRYALRALFADFFHKREILLSFSGKYGVWITPGMQVNGQNRRKRAQLVAQTRR